MSNTVLIMGLDDSGKTSLFNHYFDGVLFHPLPTELIEERKQEFYGNNLVFREIGGRYRFRPQWYDNIKDAKGLIWVFDSIDSGRRIESKEELDALLKREEVANLPLLFIANKQDSRFIMPWEEVEEKFNFEELKKGRKLQIIKTTKFTCENMTEGLLWLLNEMGMKPVEDDASEEGEKCENVEEQKQENE